MKKRLYRSRKDKVISGVCGGVAEYLEMDPTIIRLIWALTLLIGGTGIVLYIVAIIVVPMKPIGDADEIPVYEEDDDDEYEYDVEDMGKEQTKKGKDYFAVGLIAVGIMLILSKLNFFSNVFIWPILLIAMGAYILISRKE